LRLNFQRYKAENVFTSLISGVTSLFFNVKGAARDTDNNKLHNEKTPQPTKGQRYDRLKRKRIFQISWKELP
jgi:hypothetical protein